MCKTFFGWILFFLEPILYVLLGLVGRCKGWWPSERTMRAAHGAMSAWAPELVMTRQGQGGLEVLLTRYEGGIEQFRGLWHIPGGYNRMDELGIAETCSVVARRELGVDVRFAGILDAYKWKRDEHPYGRPLSIYVACTPVVEVVETETRRYFPVDALPEAMVGPHRRFLGTILQ